MRRSGDILIVGRRPPPVGGVTVHVDRLCDAMAQARLGYQVVDVRAQGLPATARRIARHRVCHLHLSHPAAMFALALWCRLARTTCVMTVHGDLDRFIGVNRWFARAAVRLAHVPVLLNASSHRAALALNPAALQMSAYIRPLRREPLPAELERALRAHLAAHRPAGPVMITNAFRLAYDPAGREIYGVFALIEWSREKGLGLILSDPSGTYQTAAHQRLAQGEAAHVLFLVGPHSFIEALAFADVFVRNTVTDGDSLSIHEALAAGKPVWATTVVPRPPGVWTYSTLADIDPHRRAMPPEGDTDCSTGLIGLYRSLLA